MRCHGNRRDIRIAFPVLSLALCLAASPLPAGVVLHCVKVPSAPESVDLLWQSYPARSLYRIWRSAEPSDIKGSGAVLGDTDLTSYPDLAAPAPAFYLVEGACADDPLEENDNTGEATEAQPGDTYYNDLRICLLDDDWFKVYLFSWETSSAEIQFDNAQGDLDLEAYDFTLRLIGSSSSGSSTEHVDCPAAAGEGWYYYRVFAPGFAENAYTARIRVPFEIPPCMPDLLEPNETPAKASEGWPATSSYFGLSLCSNEQADWFAQDLAAGRVFFVNLLYNTFYPPYELALELYGADQTTLLKTGTGDPARVYLEYDVVTAGLHYLKVGPAAPGNFQNDYDVIWMQ